MQLQATQKVPFFCQINTKYVCCMNKRTGFDLYFNIFNIKTHSDAYGSKICGDSGVAVGSCLAREHKYTVLARLNDMW